MTILSTTQFETVPADAELNHKQRSVSRPLPAPRPASSGTALTACGVQFPGGGFDSAIEWMLVILLSFMPLAFGAVNAWSELVVVGLCSLIAMTLAARLIVYPRRGLIWTWLYVPIVLFLGFVAFQAIPLPESVVKTISPEALATRSRLFAGLSSFQDGSVGPTTLSLYPNATLRQLRLLFCVSTIFIAVVNILRDTRQLKRLLTAVAAIAACIAVLDLAQISTGSDKVYWIFPMAHRDSGTFANHSHFGQFMNLSIGAMVALLLLRVREMNHARELSPFSLVRSFGRQDVRRVCALTVAIALSSAAIFLSLTRGGILGWSLGFIIVSLMLARQRVKGLALIIAAPVLLGLCALLFVGFDKVYDRLATFRRLDAAEHQLDWARWQIARDVAGLIFPRFPLVGTGLGTHEVVYPTVQRVRATQVFAHADNDYVQLLEECGLVGVALGGLFLFGIFASYVSNVVRDRSFTVRAVSIGLGFGLVAILCQSLTDFGQHIPAIACLTALSAAILVALPRVARGDRQSTGRLDMSMPAEVHSTLSILFRRFTAICGTLACVAAAGWCILGAQSTARAEAAWMAARPLDRQLRLNQWNGTNEQYGSILNQMESAVRHEPNNVRYLYWLSAYRWQSLARLRDPQTGALPEDPRLRATVADIVTDLHAGRLLCPTFAPAYSAAGQLEISVLKQPEAGRRDIQTAFELAKYDTNVYFTAACLDARSGASNAAEELRDCIEMDPLLMPAAIVLCLDELHAPALAITTAGHDFQRLAEVTRALDQRKLPEAEIARTAWTAALETACKNPNASADVFAALAQHYDAVGRYTEAATCFRRSVALDYRHFERRTSLARALYNAGQYQQAIDEAKACLRSQPDSESVKALVREISLPPKQIPGDREGSM